MKSVWVLMLLLGLCGSASAQHACDRVMPFSHTIASTTPVELVPAVPGQRVYYCGFMITQKGNTLDLIIMVGQGPNCATNQIKFTPQLSLPNDFALSSRMETVGPYSDAGYALCIQTLGTGALCGMIYFAQF
jgi:hypothetical protein